MCLRKIFLCSRNILTEGNRQKNKRNVGKNTAGRGLNKRGKRPEPDPFDIVRRFHECKAWCSEFSSRHVRRCRRKTYLDRGERRVGLLKRFNFHVLLVVGNSVEEDKKKKKEKGRKKGEEHDKISFRSRSKELGIFSPTLPQRLSFANSFSRIASLTRTKEIIVPFTREKFTSKKRSTRDKVLDKVALMENKNPGRRE